MKLTEFDYELPPELIAQHPTNKRETARMMVLDRNKESIEHKYFYDIADYLTSDDLIVLNNTKVIPARIFGKKETGAQIEIFLIRSIDEGTWECLIRPQKRIRPGSKIILSDNSTITVLCKSRGQNWLIETSSDFNKRLDNIGKVPLPPYIKRSKTDACTKEDIERYQTIYAKEPGAVAAPTAGLHFTPQIMDKLKQKGVKIAEITLHVGLGTFKPVKSEYIEDHIMHTEYFNVTQETAELISKQKAENKRVIAIGTTSIRTLETIAMRNAGEIEAYTGWSDIFIYPGYRFKVIDSCLTNFHLPKSTLIMLISALAGYEYTFKAYKEAIKENYRFFSYGDCMLIL